MAIQELCFIFNDVLYKQKDGAPLAWDCLLDVPWQMFSCHFMNSNGFSSVLRNLNQFFTEDMLMKFLFSSNQLKTSQKFVIILILVIQTSPFALQKEKDAMVTFLDVKVSRKKVKFPTTVYRRPTFSGVYTHFECLLTTVCNGYMVICYGLCSCLSLFGLSFLKIVFLKNGYPLSFMVNHLFIFLKHLLISCS